MSSTTHVFCDICKTEIDRTQETKGFAAVTIIAIKYKFEGLKAINQGPEKKDFDICYECSDKLSKYLEEEIKNAEKKVEKVEEIKT